MTILKSNDKWMLCHIVTALLVGLNCLPNRSPISHQKRYFRQRGYETKTLEQWLESFPKPSVKGKTSQAASAFHVHLLPEIP